MGAHPLDELSCRVSGRKLRNALVQKPAISQKFDVSKDLLLARFGSSVAMSQEFRRRNLAGHGRECSNQAANAGSKSDDLAGDHDGLHMRLTTTSIGHAALLVLIPLLVAAKPIISQQTICDAVQSYVKVLVDYTKTTCTPVDASSDTFAFLVLSSQPIFS